MRRKFLAVSMAAAFFLGACGVKGTLKTPPPLWGEKAKQDYEQKQQQEAPSEKQEERAQDSSTPDT